MRRSSENATDKNGRCATVWDDGHLHGKPIHATEPEGILGDRFRWIHQPAKDDDGIRRRSLGREIEEYGTDDQLRSLETCLLLDFGKLQSAFASSKVSFGTPPTCDCDVI